MLLIGYHVLTALSRSAFVFCASKCIRLQHYHQQPSGFFFSSPCLILLLSLALFPLKLCVSFSSKTHTDTHTYTPHTAVTALMLHSAKRTLDKASSSRTRTHTYILISVEKKSQQHKHSKPTCARPAMVSRGRDECGQAFGSIPFLLFLHLGSSNIVSEQQQLFLVIVCLGCCCASCCSWCCSWCYCLLRYVLLLLLLCWCVIFIAFWLPLLLPCPSTFCCRVSLWCVYVRACVVPFNIVCRTARNVLYPPSSAPS